MSTEPEIQPCDNTEEHAPHQYAVAIHEGGEETAECPGVAADLVMCISFASGGVMRGKERHTEANADAILMNTEQHPLLEKAFGLLAENGRLYLIHTRHVEQMWFEPHDEPERRERALKRETARRGGW